MQVQREAYARIHHVHVVLSLVAGRLCDRCCGDELLQAKLLSMAPLTIAPPSDAGQAGSRKVAEPVQGNMRASRCAGSMQAARTASKSSPGSAGELDSVHGLAGAPTHHTTPHSHAPTHHTQCLQPRPHTLPQDGSDSTCSPRQLPPAYTCKLSPPSQAGMARPYHAAQPLSAAV